MVQLCWLHHSKTRLQERASTLHAFLAELHWLSADPVSLQGTAAWQPVPDKVFLGADVHCLAWAPSSAASIVVHLAAGVGGSLVCSSW